MRMRTKVLSQFRFELLKILYAMLIVALFACSKEDDAKPTKKPPVTEEEPKQYDVPFANVPATGDVVMYEVNLWAFSATSNMKGVENKLDHLQDLGVNVVWLMPIYPRGELKGVGSPYAVRNYKQVSSAFGNLEDLRSLVKKAHERDIAVILDWVANHTAWDNPWIQNTTWYTRNGSGTIQSPAGTNWYDVADLNYGSLAMRKEMINAMKYWVLEANVDGFRCDYADGVPADFWKQAIDTLRSIPNRDIIMFAEASNKQLFTSGFDLIFGWNFYGKVRDVFEDNVSATNLSAANTNDYSSVPEGSHILRWITNHDDNAWDDTPVNIFGGQSGALSAFVLSAYMGGVPLIYNGQEVGYPNKLSFFNNSTPKLDWSLNPSVLTQYQKLLSFRNASEAVRNGSIETYASNDVMAFKRIVSGEEVFVVVNVRNNTKDYDVPVALEGTEWENVMTGESITLGASLSLQSYEYLILKK